jgi:hypothetical protein
MERIISSRRWERLLRRAPLPLDPRRSIAIKRDCHVFEVGTDAATLARAFRDVATDPESTFGLIRVKRAAHRTGRPFAAGERFQGCFSLEKGILAVASRGPLRRARGALARLFALRPVAAAITWIEDLLLSDYGEIVDLILDEGAEGPYRLRYRYLEGTPIAGSSTFTIEPLGPERCRLTQVFEFQEVNAIALHAFERFGLKYHDQVVHMQVHKAAARAGARVLSGTIPDRYAALPGGELAAGAPAVPAPIARAS